MTSVIETANFSTLAENIWKIIRQFGEVDTYISVIKKSTSTGNTVGDTRELTLESGEIIIERLEKFNDNNRILVYSIQSGPFPITNYLSTMKINELDSDSCQLIWSSTFEATPENEQDMKNAVSGIYKDGFAGIEAKMLS